RGGAAGEDQLVRVLRVDVPANDLAGTFLRLGGQGAQRMNAAMHVRIDRGVVSAFRLDHAARFLAGGGVVEVHERPAGCLFLQDRELRTDRGNVVALLLDRVHFGAHSVSSFASIMPSRCLRHSGLAMRSSTSVMKACAIILRASASLTPRERR